MKILQYALLACLFVFIIANDDDEEKEEATEGDDTGAMPTAPLKPAAAPTDQNTVAQNPAGQNGGKIKEQEQPQLSPKGKKKPRLPKRCLFKPEQGNCAGSRLLQRWWYNPDTNRCESFSYPVCTRKHEAFVSCWVCMNRCMTNKQRREKAMWIKKVCQKSPKVKSG
uniref:Anticoagulant protein rhipilin 1 n=1 Tax=Rhipicephalus zambeziensis TaxID=60191 RepID=A0A224Y3X3_9ACAR